MSACGRSPCASFQTYKKTACLPGCCHDIAIVQSSEAAPESSARAERSPEQLDVGTKSAAARSYLFTSAERLRQFAAHDACLLQKRELDSPGMDGPLQLALDVALSAGGTQVTRVVAPNSCIKRKSDQSLLPGQVQSNVAVMCNAERSPQPLAVDAVSSCLYCWL